MKFRAILFLFIPVLLASSCQRQLPPFEWFPDMADSYAVESQEADYFNPTGSGVRLPPQGTVPRGWTPYPYSKKEYPRPDNLPRGGLANPIEKKTLAVYKRGEERFQIYCMPCHGVRGAGNGPVVGPAPRLSLAVPPVTSEKIQNWTDGQLYHIITHGRGQMGSYGAQVPPNDRWKIILYIRKLQEAVAKKETPN
ncbi:MAG: cytochrome c [Spirochaetota bacterium]